MENVYFLILNRYIFFVFFITYESFGKKRMIDALSLKTHL